jgi:hypothetical protein
MEWCRENGACICIYVYICDVFSNFVLSGDVDVIQVCIVGANGSMCVVLGENMVFQICDPLV